MQRGYARVVAAIAVVVVWIAITVNFGRQWSSAKHPIDQDLSTGFSWPILSASVFLIIALVVFRWRDVGLNRPFPHTWKLVWFPAVFIGLFLMIGCLLGLPPVSILFVMLINSLLIGWSEELAFRGILFSAFRARFRLWLAIGLTCVAFGSVHILNGFTTGDFGGALVQAGATAVSGLLFAALVIRTGSIFPAMVVHALWDYSAFVMLASMRAGGGADVAPSTDSLSLANIVLPFALELPNFLYALYLLRGSRSALARAA